MVDSLRSSFTVLTMANANHHLHVLKLQIDCISCLPKVVILFHFPPGLANRGLCFVQIRRFSRFFLGEGLEKKSQDFAAEVAAQTGQS